MASLKCSHCGFGIHYHDEPNGIELYAFSQKLWNFNLKTDKPIVSFTESDEGFLIVWRCPECDCLHVFKGYEPRIKQAYAPSDDLFPLMSAEKYLFFVDSLRDKVFDEEWTAAQFMQSGEYPNDQFFYAKVGDAGVIVYEDADCSTPLRRYKAIETVMEG